MEWQRRNFPWSKDMIWDGLGIEIQNGWGVAGAQTLQAWYNDFSGKPPAKKSKCAPLRLEGLDATYVVKIRKKITMRGEVVLNVRQILNIFIFNIVKLWFL